MEQTYDIPNVHISDLERMVNKFKANTDLEDAEVSFEFILNCFFPTVWNNIQKEMSHQYTLGYIAGTKEAEKNMAAFGSSDDADCYCE